MKKLYSLSVLLSIAIFAFTQEPEPLYMLQEFMYVEEENRNDYWEIEEFWSKIHKQRIAEGNIRAWIMWELTPSGSEQGAQYMLTTMFRSLRDMLGGIPGDKFPSYVRNAHPEMSQDELDSWFLKTAKSRNLTHQIFTKQINGVGSLEHMKVGTLMKFDVMKQTDSNYPVMEDQIFKPWHQQEVDDGKKLNWGLVEVLLPMGSTAFGSHITYSMYDSLEQLAASMENWGGETDLITEITIQDGLKTREWKEVKVARLVKIIQ